MLHCKPISNDVITLQRPHSLTCLIGKSSFFLSISNKGPLPHFRRWRVITYCIIYVLSNQVLCHSLIIGNSEAPASSKKTFYFYFLQWAFSLKKISRLVYGRLHFHNSHPVPQTLLVQDIIFQIFFLSM